MPRTIADLKINTNMEMATGIIETRSRINRIGTIAQNRIDVSNPTIERKGKIKQLGFRKKPTD